MDDFKQGIQDLEVSAYQAGPLTPTPAQGQYPASGERLCVGLGLGFGGGLCGGFGGGFCGGFGGGF
jgi:hypothetical protein